MPLTLDQTKDELRDVMSGDASKLIFRFDYFGQLYTVRVSPSKQVRTDEPLKYKIRLSLYVGPEPGDQGEAVHQSWYYPDDDPEHILRTFFSHGDSLPGQTYTAANHNTPRTDLCFEYDDIDSYTESNGGDMFTARILNQAVDIYVNEMEDTVIQSQDAFSSVDDANRQVHNNPSDLSTGINNLLNRIDWQEEENITFYR